MVVDIAMTIHLVQVLIFDGMNSISVMHAITKLGRVALAA